MIEFTDNPVLDAERYAAEQERELQKLPVCSECGEHIQDEEAYFINGEWVCESCMSSYKRMVEYGE